MRGRGRAITVCAALAVAASCGDRPASQRDELQLAVAHQGRFEGETALRQRRRLPASGDRTGDAWALAPLLRAARSAAADGSPAGQVHLAVAEIGTARHDQALARLQLALLSEETVAGLCALAVSHLTRFAARGDPVDLVAGAAVSERALELQPGSVDAAFNLLLARAHLNVGGEQAALIARLPTADAELVRDIRPSSRDAGLAAWETLERELLTAHEPADREILAALTRRYPLYTREFALERLLPAWATEHAAGRSHPGLQMARTLGRLHAEIHSELMLADTVAAIDEAAANGRGRDMGRALVRFGAAVVDYNQQALEAAEKGLARSGRELAALGSPLAHWARFYQGVAAYFRDSGAGRAIFERLEVTLAGERYGGLRGRVQWLLGTVALVQGRLAQSVRHYRQARDLLAVASGPAATAFIDVLLAEALTRQGDMQAAWDHRLRALRQVPVWEADRRQIAMLSEAGASLMLDARCDLALVFLDEAVRVAERWGAPLGLSTAYSRRARCHTVLGRRDRAKFDILTSRAAVEAMEAGALRSMQRYFLDLAEGLAILEERPTAAATLLTAAFDEQEAKGYRFERIAYLNARATAHLRSGALEDGRADLDAAVTAYESLAEEGSDPFARVRALRQAVPAYRQLTELALHQAEATYAAAFRQGERGRAAVDQLLGERTSLPPPPGIEALQSRLAAGVAAIVYSVLPRDVLAWVVTADEVQARRLGLDPGRLEEHVERMTRWARVGQRDEPGQRDASELWNRLVGPLALDGRGLSTLVFIADPPLSGLPFGALYDADREEFLVERYAIAFAPSVSLLLQRNRASPSSSAADSVLVVGVGRAFAPTLGLPTLPGVEAEVKAVLAHYRLATAAREERATAARVLEALSAHSVVHFAGHAVPNSRSPLDAGIALAPGAAEDLGLLRVRDIVEPGRLRARLVVLSSCATLSVDAPELPGVLGLAGAMARSGVTAILASAWESDDRVSPILMSAFHERYSSGELAAQALRGAILSRFSQPGGGLTRPRDWANLRVVGSLGAVQR